MSVHLWNISLPLLLPVSPGDPSSWAGYSLCHLSSLLYSEPQWGHTGFLCPRLLQPGQTGKTWPSLRNPTIKCWKFPIIQMYPWRCIYVCEVGNCRPFRGYRLSIRFQSLVASTTMKYQTTVCHIRLLDPRIPPMWPGPRAMTWSHSGLILLQELSMPGRLTPSGAKSVKSKQATLYT